MSQIFNYTWFILCLTGQKLRPLIRRHFLRWNLFINYWEHLTLRKTWFHLVFTCRYRSHWRLGLLEHLLVFWLAWTLFLVQFFFAHGCQVWHWGPIGHRNSLRSRGPKSVLEFTRWCGLRFLDLIRRWLLSLISFELILKLHFRANLWEESWRLFYVNFLFLYIFVTAYDWVFLACHFIQAGCWFSRTSRKVFIQVRFSLWSHHCRGGLIFGYGITVPTLVRHLRIRFLHQRTSLDISSSFILRNT